MVYDEMHVHTNVSTYTYIPINSTPIHMFMRTFPLSGNNETLSSITRNSTKHHQFQPGTFMRQKTEIPGSDSDSRSSSSGRRQLCLTRNGAKMTLL